MNKVFTILAIMVGSVIYAQTPKKMVLIPDYTIEYETKVQERIYNEVISRPNYTNTRTSHTNINQDFFNIGNFNRNVIINNIMVIPPTTVDNNNYEYAKTARFNPDKTLREILRNDKQ